MRETTICFHNLEWPEPQATLCGPLVWLRGWVVGKPGCDCIDLRVRHDGSTHLGILGLPRTDLATHFKSDKSWLPAEYIIGVPVNADGTISLTLEVMDAHGIWHALETIDLTIAPGGILPPRVEGRIEASPDGTWTTRDTHYPFQGHLDQPGSTPILVHGRAPVFGWLLDENELLSQVLATTDTLVFNHLEHSQTDAALALKFPEHPNARHARLKGAVDYPATLIEPALLRVYAVSHVGEVTLCFAQRIAAEKQGPFTRKQTTDYRPVDSHELAAYPSGRPRRALFMLRALLPDDACLRALDLVRHLKKSNRWAVRVVAMEDGPMRDAFLKIDTESLIVDPGSLYSAPGETEAGDALAHLEKQIRWDHLDAFVIFDPLCGWALPLAKQHGVSTLFDCGQETLLQPDQTAILYVQDLVRRSWQSADAVCFPSQSMARAQKPIFLTTPVEVIPYWHTPGIAAMPPAPDSRIAMAPLRTADWLHQHHPEVATRWQFRQGPATETSREKLSRLDEQFNVPTLQATLDWSASNLDLCLGPLFGRGPLRPILDALASNIPTIAVQTPTTKEYLAGSRLPMIEGSNPLALAHHLIVKGRDPDYLKRETEITGAYIRKHHAPDCLLTQWETLLASVAARPS